MVSSSVINSSMNSIKKALLDNTLSNILLNKMKLLKE